MADDRYSTITREVPVERPRNTVYAATAGATGELNSQHRVTEHPAGFRVRERGALDATVVHAYRCPVHGVFEVAVPWSAVPDDFECPHQEPWDACPCGAPLIAGVCSVLGCFKEPRFYTCSVIAPWAGSSCGIGHSAGEVTS